MLVAAGEGIVVGHLGWVDRGSLWVLDTASGAAALLELGDYEYLVLVDGERDWFSVRRQLESGGWSVSVHHLADPATVIASARRDGEEVTLEGPADAWSHVARVYAGWDPAEGAYVMLRIEPGGERGDVHPLEWFNRDDYDLGYQSVLTPAEVPGSDVVVVPVQRSSELVLYDALERAVVRKVMLAGHYGNPTARFRSERELWADDYDTLVRVDASDWSVVKAKRLQSVSRGSQRFIGRWDFTSDRTRCIVARPFSGDVLVLDTERMRVTHRAKLGRQPLDAAVLSDGRVFARDWQTGDLVTGVLSRTRLVH